MENIRSNHLDTIWLMVVLIHVIGSTLTGLIMLVPFGLILFNTIFWIYIAYNNRQEKIGIFLCGIGWSIQMYLLHHLPGDYRSSLLMNLFVLFYGLYLHFGNVSFLMKENQIRFYKIKEFAIIIPATFLFILIGTYINSLSMLAFQNHVQDSLVSVSENVLWGILVLALAPAITEELMFRGMVFQRLGSGKKAILLSAFLFALCHMNFNQMCYAFVMGIFFAVIYAATENLLVTMTIHFLFNTYTVLTHAFSENGFVKGCDQFQIFGYYPFGNSFAGESQTAFLLSFLVGTLIALLACFLLYILLKVLFQKEERQGMKEKENWKPGIAFYGGIVICMLIAILLR